MSLSVSISQPGAGGGQVKSIEVGVSREAGLGDLIQKLRQVQSETNEYLTNIIGSDGSGTGAKDEPEDEECDEDDEEDDQTDNEPRNKVAKMQ